MSDITEYYAWANVHSFTITDWIDLFHALKMKKVHGEIKV